jgi:mRNA interferase HigB
MSFCPVRDTVGWVAFRRDGLCGTDTAGHDGARQNSIGLLRSCSHGGSTVYWLSVRIISRRVLRGFWEHHPDAEQPLRAWYHDAKRAHWRSPAAIKRAYSNASIVANDRVVFNIKGNRYRLVTAINYRFEICYIRFVGTHQDYDRIDVTTI